MLFRLPAALLCGALLSWACGGDEVQPVAGKVSAAPLELDFGRVAVGAEVEAKVELRNVGAIPIRVEIRELPDSLAVNSSTLLMEVDGSTEMAVSFRPSRAGAYREALKLVVNDTLVHQRISVAGEGILEALEIEERLEFGGVAVGDSRELGLVLRNLTDHPLRPDLRLQGSAGFDAERSELVLEGDAEERLGLRFGPEREGRHLGIAELRPCPGCVRREVSLRGDGVDAELGFYPSRLAFGKVPVGGSARQMLVLLNEGKTSLDVSAEIEGGVDAFTVVDSQGLRRVGRGEVEVEFSPSEGVAAAGLLRLGMEGGEALGAVDLAGEGVVPQIVAEPPALDFGATVPGLGVRRTVRVRDLGGEGTVSLVATGVEGAEAERFAVVASDLPIALDHGSMELELHFHPLEIGSSNADLLLQFNHGLPSLRIPLFGEAVASDECALGALTESIRFGLVSESFVGERSFILRNLGSGRCLLWGLGVEGEDAEVFEVEAADGSENALGPGEAKEFVLRAALGGKELGYVPRAVVVRSGPSAHPRVVEIPILLETSAAIEAMPVPAIFAETPIDRARVEEVGAPSAAGIGGLRFASGSSKAFRLPASQGSWGRLPVDVAFIPEELGLHRGQLEIRMGLSALPLLVDLEGLAGPPCEACEGWPAPACEIPTTVALETEMAFEDTWPHLCNWIVDDPDGPTGMATFAKREYEYAKPSPSACEGTVRFLRSGTFEMSNLRVRGDGRAAPCTSRVEVIPPPGLWVEFAPRDNLQYFEVALLRGGDPANRASWFAGDAACWAPDVSQPVECAPGVAGMTDDASFTWIGFPNSGTTRLHIPEPSPGEAYSIGYFGEPTYLPPAGWRPDSSLEIQIYCDGALVSEIDRSLYSGENRFRLHGQVVAGAQSCTFLPDGLTEFPFRIPR